MSMTNKRNSYVMKKEIILSVRIDEEMYAQIRKLAESDDRSMAWVARKLMESALNQRTSSSGENK